MRAASWSPRRRTLSGRTMMALVRWVAVAECGPTASGPSLRRLVWSWCEAAWWLGGSPDPIAGHS
eukprot:6476354-Alexandrium_andersonii.AAC.1